MYGSRKKIDTRWTELNDEANRIGKILHDTFFDELRKTPLKTLSQYECLAMVTDLLGALTGQVLLHMHEMVSHAMPKNITTEETMAILSESYLKIVRSYLVPVKGKH